MSGYIFFHGKHIRFLVTTLPPEMPLVSGSPAFLWLRKFDPFFFVKPSKCVSSYSTTAFGPHTLLGLYGHGDPSPYCFVVG